MKRKSGDHIMNNKIKKLDYIYIKFQDERVDELYTIIQPFLIDKYYKIFFKEMIEDGDDFTFYIRDKKEQEEFYELLETLKNHKLRYELSYYEKTPDDYDGGYYNKCITYDLEELKKFEIGYQELRKGDFDFDINDFALSPDGKYLVTATERNMFVWSMESYSLLSHQIAWDGTAEKIYFSSDSNYHITLINDMGSWQNTVQVWKPLDDLVTQWEWIEEDDFNFYYIQSQMKELSPSLEHLFSNLVESCYGGGGNYYSKFYSFDFSYNIAYEKNSLTLFLSEKSNKIETIYLDSKLKALTFSYDSKFIALGQEEDIEIFSTDDLKQIKILESHQEPIVALATSRDNRYLLSASKEQTLKLWSLENFELLVTIESGFRTPITAIDFSVDSQQIVISSKEGIKIFNVESREPIYHLFNDEGFWCRLDGSGELLEKGLIDES